MALTGSANQTDATNFSETKDITVYITINHDNAALSKVITACEATPVLITVNAKTGVNTTTENTFEVYASANSVSSGAILMTSSLNLKDQYDVDYLNDSQIIIISGLVSKDAQINKNASNDPKSTGLVAGDSYTATITYGGKTYY